MSKRWRIEQDICALIVAFLILAILLLSWFCRPHELMGWAFGIALLLLILACLVNYWNIVVDFIESGKTPA